MPWARLLMYAGWIRALRAEEELGDLSITHTADPKELANRLRAAASGYTVQEYETAKERASRISAMVQTALESKGNARPR